MAWLVALLQWSCTPSFQERCRIVAQNEAAPEMPPGFMEVDRVLVERAHQLVLDARELRGSLAIQFRMGFGEQLLPELCGRLERARAFAAMGKVEKAGHAYQALLLASQVVHLAIALHTVAEHADVAGQPGATIDEILKTFAAQIAPLLSAALTEDPMIIERALLEHGKAYASWVHAIDLWASRIDSGARRVRIAKHLWDLVMLVVATHEAARAAASIAGAGRPPMPPLPGLVVSGSGAGMASRNLAASIELAEALRKLIASGAMDAVVVAGMSRMLGAPSGSPPDPSQVPGTLAMTGPPDPKADVHAAPDPSAKGRLKAAALPTSGKVRYVPPDDWTPGQPLPRGSNHGYLDRFGNEWVKGPSRTPGQPFEWDVQLGRNATDGVRKLSRDGVHLNVSLDGEVTH